MSCCIFLNKLVFAGYIEDGDYEKFNYIKKVLTDEFQDVNSEKLINMLVVVDDLHVLFITQDFKDVEILPNILGGDFFFLIKEQMQDE